MRHLYPRIIWHRDPVFVIYLQAGRRVPGRVQVPLLQVPVVGFYNLIILVVRVGRVVEAGFGVGGFVQHMEIVDADRIRFFFNRTVDSKEVGGPGRRGAEMARGGEARPAIVGGGEAGGLNGTSNPWCRDDLYGVASCGVAGADQESR